MIDPVLPTYARAPLQFARGNGVWLYTADGDRYLDFGAGVAVNILGHAHPKLVHALQAQAEKIWHTSNLYEILGQQRLAERLVAATFADTVFFTNSGAEAMELAIKMARKYHSTQGNPERFRLITIDGAFHGRTMATISAAGKPKLTDGFGPLLEGFDIVEFNCVEAVRDAIGAHTAGVMLEPIQGEGGIRPFSTEVLQGIRRLCDEHGLLLILDEIQCGMGRTGKLFAHEWANITPDILAAAKGIGGGFPLGACLATATAAAGMGVGTHGSTYGGNPLAMAVGNAVLDVVLEDDFLATVQRRAGFLQQRLGAIAAEHPHVVETVRGEGLMLGMKCKIPVAEVVTSCHQNHLLTIAAAEDTVRIVPPLNITEEELAEGCEALDRALAALHDSATDSAGAPA